MAEQLGTTEKELIENRLTKLKALREVGVDPYPSKSNRTKMAAEVQKDQQKLIADGVQVTVAGRMTAKRGHGQLVFLDIVDESGKIQAVIKSDIISPAEFGLVDLVEVGDFLEITGSVFLTKAGELSIEAKKIQILTKAIRFLPESWYGLKDVETRYRERYVDFILNPEVKEKFYVRSKIIASLRACLSENGFVEVDTPILQSIPGGASAKPFLTHYNAYESDVYLRVAPELYLKRLLVGGFEKVFEFARCFRNEGVDATHNPEFTNLEFYWAYTDYEKLMDFTEELIRNVVSEVNAGKLTLEVDGKTIDFGQKFKRLTFHELTNGSETDEAFKAGIRNIVAPTFVTNHPTSLLPLAKRNVDNPKVVDSFQLVLAGLEIVKAFSELNDPVDQRTRFLEQAKMREKGDEEAQRLDDDFLKAIEYGMPPTAGWGMGVDRFVRILTDSQTLREVLFFPFMKPVEKQVETGRAKETKEVVIILNHASGLNNWQQMNAIAHLSASWAGRENGKLFLHDKIKTKDGSELTLNIQHAIMIRRAETNADLLQLIQDCQKQDIEVFQFTREMLETTNDRKIVEITAGKDDDEIEFLGVALFGSKKIVDDLSEKFELIK